MKILALISGILFSFLLIWAMIISFGNHDFNILFNPLTINYIIIVISGFYLYNLIEHHSDKSTAIPRLVFIVSIIFGILISLWFLGGIV